MVRAVDLERPPLYDTFASRDLLATSHSNPSDPTANEVLSTVYHTLITATLQTWSPPKNLGPQALVDFIQAVLESLPSPSSSKSPNAAAFGELVVDLIWTIDAELDDIQQDSKMSLANAEQGKTTVAEGVDIAVVLARIAQTKQKAEADKEALAGLLKVLVVRRSYTFLVFYANMRPCQTAGILDANVCRERLELPLICNAGLIPDEQAFSKKEVRVRTALL